MCDRALPGGELVRMGAAAQGAGQDLFRSLSKDKPEAADKESTDATPEECTRGRGHQSNQGLNYIKQDKQLDARVVAQRAARSMRRDPFLQTSLVSPQLDKRKATDSKHNKDEDPADFKKGRGKQYIKTIETAEAADSELTHSNEEGWSLVRDKKKTYQIKPSHLQRQTESRLTHPRNLLRPGSILSGRPAGDNALHDRRGSGITT